MLSQGSLLSAWRLSCDVQSDLHDRQLFLQSLQGSCARLQRRNKRSRGRFLYSLTYTVRFYGRLSVSSTTR